MLGSFSGRSLSSQSQTALGFVHPSFDFQRLVEDLKLQVLREADAPSEQKSIRLTCKELERIVTATLTTVYISWTPSRPTRWSRFPSATRVVITASGPKQVITLLRSLPKRIQAITIRNHHKLQILSAEHSSELLAAIADRASSLKEFHCEPALPRAATDTLLSIFTSIHHLSLRVYTPFEPTNNHPQAANNASATWRPAPAFATVLRSFSLECDCAIDLSGLTPDDDAASTSSDTANDTPLSYPLESLTIRRFHPPYITTTNPNPSPPLKLSNLSALSPTIKTLNIPDTVFTLSEELQQLQHLRNLTDLSVSEISVHAFLALPQLAGLQSLRARKLCLWSWVQLRNLRRLAVSEQLLVPTVALPGALAASLPSLEEFRCLGGGFGAGYGAAQHSWRDLRRALVALQGHAALREVRIHCRQCDGWPAGVLASLPRLRVLDFGADTVSEAVSEAVMADVAACGGLQCASIALREVVVQEQQREQQRRGGGAGRGGSSAGFSWLQQLRNVWVCQAGMDL